MTEIRPAPKQLAMLAAEMRPDWPYDETRAALIAASTAGWDVERIYRVTFRLLLLPDSSPADLRQEARDPRQRDPRPGPGLPTDPDTIAALAEYRAKAAHSDPEGDEAA